MKRKLNSFKFLKLFSLIAFVVAILLTCELIANIYDKRNNTFVILDILPNAISVLKVPKQTNFIKLVSIRIHKKRKRIIYIY